MLTLYNYLTRQKEEFHPLKGKKVGLYTCGPTVYNFAHIGNLRTYIFEDVLRRTLEHAGYEVKHIMNLTDVEDKLIRDAQKAGQNIFDFVKPYEQSFFEDIDKLNIQPAEKYPKATEHIPEMIALIQNLLDKGLAYKSNGSVYFHISKFKDYGRLSGIDKSGLKAGARVDADEYNKEDVQDFVLWKAKKEGEPFWPAPFGEGRPGWHIECSAMSMKYLGSTLDIHAGGIDLLFPHHENEIAQSEGATGLPFVKYFVEGEHLLVDGQKMSKSLGNFYTLRDIEKKGYSPLAFRYLILTSHYRSSLNFTWESLAGAESALEKIFDFIRGLLEQKTTGDKDMGPYKKDFTENISADLDTAGAIAIVWKIISDYRADSQAMNSREILKLLYDFDEILGLGLKNIKVDKAPQKIKDLAEERERLRNEKEWNEADKIRKEIEELGWDVKDTSEGPELKKR